MAERKPSVRTLLGRGVTKACPACGQRGLFRRWFKMAECCPRCGLKFERIEGHWIGAIGMNTIISFALLAVSLVGLLIATAPESPIWVLVVSVGVALVFPAFFDPFSRTLWTGIDIAMRPLEAHEVDWAVVDPDLSTTTPKAETDTDG